MSKGPLITVCLSLAALGAVVGAFSSNASPYVTVAEAKTRAGDRLHIAGDILPNTVRLDRLRHVMEFSLRDADGATVHVIHTGEPPANLAEAKKVVVVGGMRGSDFVSTQLLVKCPSKYQADGSASPSGSQ